jgi:hypothetical protein
MKEKICRRCNESWPNDAEFYKPGALNCLACQFEARQAHKRKAKERIAALPKAEQEQRRLAENERARKKAHRRHLKGKKSVV